jgi:hypothetical protein
MKSAELEKVSDRFNLINTGREGIGLVDACC